MRVPAALNLPLVTIALALLASLCWSSEFVLHSQARMQIPLGLPDNPTSTAWHGRAMLDWSPFKGRVEAKKNCMSNMEQGVCYKSSYCKKIGGSAGDSCGAGGVCCILRSSCSANTTAETVTVRRNVTHLVAPTSYYMNANQCRFVIKKRAEVCQIRLDFNNFKLAGPMDGSCETEVLTITGAANMPVFKLCGDAANQHLYLDFGSSESITISVNLMSDGSSARSTYDILVTMIPCNSPYGAPEGCGQLYTEATGDIYSFNYHNDNSMNSNNGGQLNDQKYTVCVKPSAGASQIKWTKCPNANDRFFITGTPPVNQSQSGSDCVTDYVEILGAGKFCGSDFPGVTTTAKPFTMYVNFDDIEIQGSNLPVTPSGCPLGWFCYGGPPTDFTTKAPCGNPIEDTCKCDGVGEVCIPPAYLPESDFENNGFCVSYTTISST